MLLHAIVNYVPYFPVSTSCEFLLFSSNSLWSWSFWFQSECGGGGGLVQDMYYNYSVLAVNVLKE